MEYESQIKTPSVIQRTAHFITSVFLIYISGCFVLWSMSLILEKNNLFSRDSSGLCFATGGFVRELADFYNIYNIPRWTYLGLLEHYTFTTIFLSAVIVFIVTWMFSVANKEPDMRIGSDTDTGQQEAEEAIPELAQLKKDFTDLILLDLEGNTKDDILFGLSRFARVNGLVNDEASLYSSFLEKERRATTAIGNGIALPEALYSKMNRPSALILCRTKEAVDFGSFDGRPVRIILASLNRGRASSSALQPVISYMLQLLRQEECRERIMRARTENDIYRLWKEKPPLSIK